MKKTCLVTLILIAINLLTPILQAEDTVLNTNIKKPYYEKEEYLLITCVGTLSSIALLKQARISYYKSKNGVPPQVMLTTNPATEKEQQRINKYRTRYKREYKYFLLGSVCSIITTCWSLTNYIKFDISVEDKNIMINHTVHF